MNATETKLHLLAWRVQNLEASNRRWKLVNALQCFPLFLSH